MPTTGAPEHVLLDNLLDALDRLADHKCGAVDVQALAHATAKAVSPHPTTAGDVTELHLPTAKATPDGRPDPALSIWVGSSSARLALIVRRAGVIIEIEVEVWPLPL